MAEIPTGKSGKPGKRHEELKGKVLLSEGCCQDNERTVAGRMIISRNSFDENEWLSEHTAPFDAVVTIPDGVWYAGSGSRDGLPV
jgi:hypothetical protein